MIKIGTGFTFPIQYILYRLTANVLRVLSVFSRSYVSAGAAPSECSPTFECQD